MDLFLQEVNQRIQGTLDHLKRELASIRAGRANPTFIEEIPVNVYGSRMKLLEVGTISAPQPNLLIVQVWDATIVQDIVKAIQEAALGLNPSYEGQMIRLSIPPLTTERREEFIKLVRQKMEQARVEIRQIRQSAREEWEKEEEEGEFGEDEMERRGKLLQEQINKTSEQIEEIGKSKEEELREV